MTKKRETVLFLVETSVPKWDTASMEEYIEDSIRVWQDGLGYENDEIPWPDHRQIIKVKEITKRRAKSIMQKLRSVFGITLWDDIVCKIRNL